MSADIDLYIDMTQDFSIWAMQAQSLVTLRNGNKFWSLWVHQSSYKGRDCEVRYASGDEAPYTRDGIYCGAERGFDIVAIERGVSADEARSRGLTEPNFEWPGKIYPS